MSSTVADVNTQDLYVVKVVRMEPVPNRNYNLNRFVSNSAYAIALCAFPFATSTFHLSPKLCLGILYYDYALTFEDERRLFWKSPWTRSSLLFFINRYPMLLGNLALLVVRYLHGPTAVCVHPYYLHAYQRLNDYSHAKAGS
jgi:hypothetical protein